MFRRKQKPQSNRIDELMNEVREQQRKLEEITLRQREAELRAYEQAKKTLTPKKKPVDKKVMLAELERLECKKAWNEAHQILCGKRKCLHKNPHDAQAA